MHVLAVLVALVSLGGCGASQLGQGADVSEPDQGSSSDMRTNGAAPAMAAIAHSGPLVIAMFGDSHTASDVLTSRLRHQLTKRFGDAGRGVVAMGRPPIRHYYQRDVAFGSNGEWDSAVGGATGNAEPFGITGMRMIASTPGASAWVETCDGCDTGAMVSRFVLLVRLLPAGAQIRYRVDQQPWQAYDTSSHQQGTFPLPLRGNGSESPQWAAISVSTSPGRHRLTVEHDDVAGRTFEMFGVLLLDDSRADGATGVSVDSLGLVGRRLSQLASWDWSVIGPQLALRNPAVVLLQYGTNEADDPDLRLDAVSAAYDRVITNVSEYVPNASIVIVGPPDVARQSATCLAKSRKQRRTKKTAKLQCAWQTPTVLADIVSMQRDAAIRNRVLFFDSLAAMGGPNQMDAMVNATPRLAAADHTHFTSTGYQLWADALLVGLESILSKVNR